MSEDIRSDSNVLPFKRPVKRSGPDPVLTRELGKLLIVYDQLISLLREAYDDELDSYTDGLLQMVVRCRQGLKETMDDDTAQRTLRDMRAELYQFPRNLRSLLPGIGPRLSESLEYKLGIQFASYAPGQPSS